MLEYLLLIAFWFVPGFALAESFGLWRQSLAYRIGFAFALGCAFDVSVFFLRNFYPLSISQAALVAFIAPLSLLMAKLLITKRFSFPVKPTKIDSFFLLSLAILSLIILAYFFTFPYFPEFKGRVDMRSFALQMDDFRSGKLPVLYSQVLYYGVYYLLSPMTLLSGRESLFLSREGMGLLAALSAFWVYIASRRIFNNDKSAFACSLVWISGAVWFGMVFNSGLWPNFYGLLSALFLITVSLHFIEEQNEDARDLVIGITKPQRTLQINLSALGFLLVLPFALTNAFLSHYTTLLFIPGLLIVSVGLAKRKRIGRVLLLSLTILAPIALGYFALSNLIENLLGFLQGGEGLPVQIYSRFGMAIPLPVLRFAVMEITNDLASIIMLVLLALYAVWLAKNNKEKLAWLPMILFVTIFFAAPLNNSAWRFSFVALLPLMLMAGSIASRPFIMPSLHVKSARLNKWKRKDGQRLGAGITLLFLMGGSWVANAAIIIPPNLDLQVPQEQREVYQAIVWMKDNIKPIKTDAEHEAPRNVLAINDYFFTYSEVLGGPKAYYAPDYRISTIDSLQVVLLSYRLNTDVIVVAKVSTDGAPPELSSWKWTNESFRCQDCIVYQTEYVKIFDLSEP